jgi:carboxyl-terminal processing protease
MRTAALVVLTLTAGCRSSGVGSIGAVMARDAETQALVVRDAPKGLGAEEAGLKPGDEIVMVEGFLVRDLSTVELRALLRGEIGSKLRLTVVRAGQVRHVEVQRSELLENALERQR